MDPHGFDHHLGGPPEWAGIVIGGIDQVLRALQFDRVESLRPGYIRRTMSLKNDRPYIFVSQVEAGIIRLDHGPYIFHFLAPVDAEMRTYDFGAHMMFISPFEREFGNAQGCS